MFNSQLASLVHLAIGVLDGAKNMFNEIIDHPVHAISELADGIPMVGHIKDLVHLAMGDKDAAIHSEESASRSLLVISAAALTGTTGGAAAPVLAGVVGGILADGVLTGIESARNQQYSPQGMVDIATNIVRDAKQGNAHDIGTDIFDGVVLAAGDGLIGANSMEAAIKPGKTVRIFRVEGKSLIKVGDGSKLGDFKAGDNQRIFHYKGAIAPRERLPKPTDPEALRTGHLPAEPTVVEKPTGGKGGKGGKSKGEMDPSREDFMLKKYATDFFDDHGQMIYLNFGEEDRMYGYYAQKVLNHRELVDKYRDVFEKEKNRTSGVTKRKHQIRVKSFKVLTRDLEGIEKDAVLEDQRSGDNYRGVLKVDVKAPRQYGLESYRYTPIFNKIVPDSFTDDLLWIRHLPSPLLELIQKHPLGFGKVRRFRYTRVAGASGIAEGVLHIRDLPNIPPSEASGVAIDDVYPEAIVHCRHVKTIQPATQSDEGQISKHYEYLVKFNRDSPAEWYPAQLVASDLREAFYNKAIQSAQTVSAVSNTPDGNNNLLVQRPNKDWDEVHPNQIFWQEQESNEDLIGVRELDAIMYQMYQSNPDDGVRVRVRVNDPIPGPGVVGPTPCAEKDGTPVYIASAIDVDGEVVPCKVSISQGRTTCSVPYKGEELRHQGEYDLLPIVPETMEFVDASSGTLPASRRLVLGGYEGEKKLYHAIAQIDGIWVPGKTAPHLGGVIFSYSGRECRAEQYKVL